IAQTAPDALDQSHGHHHRVLQLAAQLSREDVQLYYQIALLGRRDLPFAADPRSGFVMVLLRLLAFQPQLPDGVMDEPPPSRAPANPQAPAPSPAPPRPRSEAPRPEATAPVVASPVEPAPAGQGGGPRLSLVKPAP